MTKIIAVTACPSGVVPYLYGGRGAGKRRESERLGSKSRTRVDWSGNELTAEDVASADMVILTKDIGIKFEERFAGKTIVRVNISDAVKRADAIMSKIEAHLAQTA